MPGADAAQAVGQLVARLADQHGPSFMRDPVAELVAEPTAASSAIRLRTGQTLSPPTMQDRASAVWRQSLFWRALPGLPL